MGLNIVEKILLSHSAKKQLEDFVYAKVDFVFSNDITGPLAVQEFEKAGFPKVFNRNKISFVCDHFTPARDLKTANNVKLLKNFSSKYGIVNFFDIDKCGIEHTFLPEQGFFKPGDLIIGADSHTCTHGALGVASFGVGSTDLAAAIYSGKCWFKVPEVIKFIYKGKLNKWVSAKDLILYTISDIGVDGAIYQVMEFSGPVISKMNMDGRFTMCNMGVEAGAKAAIIEPDQETFNFLKTTPLLKGKINKSSFPKLCSDKDAKYCRVIEYDVSKIEPFVSAPHLPSNGKPVTKFKGVKVDQVVIGSCTNGRLSDLEVAAKILKGKKVKSNVRTIIFPGSYKVYRQALDKGFIQIFIDSGCMVSPPTCGPCLGGHMGILAEGEVAVATTNRNFIGRMGSPKSFVYLSSPAVAAATAVKGQITHPNNIK